MEVFDDIEYESRRLQALKDYYVLDTGYESEFDAITRLASYICKTPISLVSLIDEDRQWFKSKFGLETPQTARNISFCRFTIQDDAIFEVKDTLNDERFQENPLVTGYPNIRFYAGAPLITPEGYRLGSLCVIDEKPNELDDNQKDALRILANEVISHLEVAKKNRQLQESLTRYEEFNTMFNTSGELHCVLDEHGKIEKINQSVTKILGFEVGETLGKSMWHFCIKEDREKTLRYLEEKLRLGDRQFELETRTIAKDGSIRWISWAASVKKRKWFTNGRDITSQKQLLADLEQLSVVASKVNNGVVISNANNEVVWVNEAFEKITGYSISELAGKKMGDVLKGEETDEETIKKAREFTRNKQSFSVELLVYRKDGTPIWISVMNSVILNEAGEIDREVEIISDITTRKTHDEQISLLSLVASKTVNGVVINDANGCVKWLNDSFEKITGYSLEEVKGKRIGDILKGENTNMAELERVRKLSVEQKAFHAELLNYKKDGTPIWVSVSNTPIFDPNGAVEQEIEIVNDISERKLAEKELIKTREEAVQLSKAKEMFLSVMSHEIRTPLNAVIGMTHILMDDNPTETQKEHLDILKFSADNLLSLLNAILDFTKIETGNVILESADMDLKGLVNHTLDTFRFKSRQEGVKLHAVVDSAIPKTVKGDQTRLYQILINLLSNSMKFTHQGEVRLSLELVAEDKETVEVKFTVSDTGIGIPKDKLQYIFEAYTQAQEDTTRKYGGTGLGLAITKRLIELFGSEIKVESVVGKGSDFIFTIKFKKAETSSVATNKPMEFKQFSANVLVVDDNDINRLLAKKVLIKWGIDPDFAINGREALDKIVAKKYNLVLMDIHMPILGGFEATSELRAMEGEYFKTLPVIALTASIMTNDIDEIGRSGMNDFVQKPFAPTELYAKIEKYL